MLSSVRIRVADGLQHAEGGYALVIEEVAELVLSSPRASVFSSSSRTRRRYVSRSCSLRGHGEGRQLGGEDLDEVLHDVGGGRRCRPSLASLSSCCMMVGMLWRMLARIRVVSYERLQGQGGGHAHGQGRVGHAVEDAAVDGQQVGLLAEVELLELLDRVAGAGAQGSPGGW